MFENLKTGNMIEKLVKLARVNNTLEKEQYDKNIKDFIPNNILREEKDILKYYYIYGEEICIKGYTIKLNNISYSFTEECKVFIVVKDIVIATGDIDFHTDIGIAWNHTLPKEMLSQIKKDSKIINKYIKDIKNYMKNNKTSEERRLQKERKELEKIFCK